MGTRAVIGTATDGGFEGRYTHWDGYPTHHGPILTAIYRELGGSLQAVLDHVVRKGQEGYWSSLLTVAQQRTEDTKPARVPCDLCSGTGTRPKGEHWDPASPWAKECGGCNGCKGTGEMTNRNRMDHWRSDNGDSWATDRDDWGAEWAYLLSESGITVLTGDWAESGTAWRRVAHVAWTEPAPDWEAIEKAGSEVAA